MKKCGNTKNYTFTKLSALPPPFCTSPQQGAPSSLEITDLKHKKCTTIFIYFINYNPNKHKEFFFNGRLKEFCRLRSSTITLLLCNTINNLVYLNLLPLHVITIRKQGLYEN